MSFFIGPNLPANVVEIGQEISQTKLDELNAGVIATQAWVVANAGGGVTIPYLQANYQPLSGMSSYLTTANATSTYAPKASPTFTGTVTIPAGASISGYLTSSTAASTYQTISGMVSYLTTASAATTYQLQSGMSSYLTTSSASNTYAPKANPTFTGTVTIPAGASISGYLTTSSASSTYQTIAGMSSYAPKNNPSFTGIVDIPFGANIVGYATHSYVTSQGYLTDAPSNGNEYVRKNGVWAIATGGGGGGGGISEAPNDGGNYLRNMSAWVNVSTLGYQTSTDVSTYVTGLGYITSSALTVTNIDLTGNFNGYSMGSGYYSFKYDSSTNTLRMQDGVGSGISISATAITFPDGSTQTKAPVGGYVDGGISGYTLTPSDAGKVIKMGNTSGPLTMSFSGSFVPGSVFYIINTSGSFSCTLDSGGMSGYAINNDFTNPFLIPINTMKTMVCVSGNEFWIS